MWCYGFSLSYVMGSCYVMGSWNDGCVIFAICIRLDVKVHCLRSHETRDSHLIISYGTLRHQFYCNNTGFSGNFISIMIQHLITKHIGLQFTSSVDYLAQINISHVKRVNKKNEGMKSRSMQ